MPANPSTANPDWPNVIPPRGTPGSNVPTLSNPNTGPDILHGIGDVGSDIWKYVLRPQLPSGWSPQIGTTSITPYTQQIENEINAGKNVSLDPYKAAVPGTPSYAQAVGQAVRPLVQQLGGLGNTKTIQAALAAGPYESAALAANPNSAANIASTISAQINDYQAGLKGLISSVGTTQTLQDILKGMGELLSYPESLSGTAGAPSGALLNPYLTQLYEALNVMRSGGTPTATPSSSTSSGYNESVANILNG